MAGVLGMILAGGEGSRLRPLTESRSKPSVPFGGSYRLIDFALNNFVNADLMRIYVLTQFKSQSLFHHLKKGWNINGITDRFMELAEPDQVCIFGSDHIYKMDIKQMLAFHQEKEASLTVSALRMPLSEASQFGVIEVDSEGRMIGFEEKPANPKSIPGDPEHALVSMGNYIFEAQTLFSELIEDADNEASTHDFGKDIIPKMFPRGDVFVYDFSMNRITGEKEEVYWRDVGTIDAYWQAHMDLLEKDAPFSLYNRKWPLHTYYPPLPPATFTDSVNGRVQIIDSLVCNGSYVRGSRIEKSVLGFRSNIASACDISQCILLGDVKVGEGCVLRRVIVDKDADIAPGTQIGVNLQEDKKHYHVSDDGIVVIPKGARVGY
ncbi:glucose-1-phosphate adenylyltransferase [Vibrio owensii]|nr:glucose-1-phosphate adenylyltransferase [Vibrio owensii]